MSKEEIIWSCIAENYQLLYNYYVWNKDQIDVFTHSLEDDFHSALIRITERLERFNYVSDEKTVAYIKSRLYFEKRTALERKLREKKKFPFIDDSEQILKLIPND